LPDVVREQRGIMGLLMQQDPVHRETFVALRARRQAYLMASRVLHPPLSLGGFYCRHCGHPLTTDSLDVHDHIRCHACGQRTRLPPGVAARVREQRVATGLPSQRALPAAEADLAGTALWASLAIAILACMIWVL
jgi:hypothetical protein